MLERAFAFFTIFCVTLITADLLTSVLPMTDWARRSILFGAMLMFGWILKKLIDPDDRDPDGDAH